MKSMGRGRKREQPIGKGIPVAKLGIKLISLEPSKKNVDTN